MWKALSLRYALCIFAIALVAGLIANPHTASAQFGDFGKVFKKVIKTPKIFDVPGTQSEPRRRSGSSSRSSEGDSTADRQGENSNTSKEVRREVDRLANARLYRSVFLLRQEWEEESRARKLEQDRDVDEAVTRFIDYLTAEHSYLRRQSDVRASALVNMNEVTKGKVIYAIEDAYQKAHLQDFERLAGELWTKDRLLVRMLDSSSDELKPFFEGVSARGPSMEDLDKVFLKTAQKVYARSLEIADLIGVSHSFDRFIRTVYEHSEDGDSELWDTGADSRYDRFATASLNGVARGKYIGKETVSTGDATGLERQFKFRFRARRVLYDCLAANYITGARSGARGGTVEASNRPARDAIPADSSIQQDYGAIGADSTESGTKPVGMPLAAGKTRPADVPLETGSAGPVTPQAASSAPRQSFVDTACNSSILQVAKNSVEGLIKPESARWNSSDLSGRGELLDASTDQGDSESVPTPARAE